MFVESFTLQFQRHHRQSNVNLEFFINELFQCSLTINCEEQQIEQENRLFQLVNLQSRDQGNGEQRITNGREKSTNGVRRQRRSHTSSSSSQYSLLFFSKYFPFFIFVAITEDQSRHQHKSKPSSNQVND